jgi:hypothetical protein
MTRPTIASLAAVALTTAGCGPRPAPRAIHPVASTIEVDTVGATVTLPVHAGRVGGRLVWHIVTESSDRADARRRGVTWAPRMAVLAGTGAVQPAWESPGGLHFTAAVDFAPEAALRAAPDSGFPPVEARPGSVGEPGYSPFVRLPDGTILNAPIIGDERRLLDRVVSLDVARMRVVLRITRGYADARHAWYISTEASDPMVAAMEGATFVPLLAAAPSAGNSGGASARFAIVAVANGATGAANPERQGMQSMFLDRLPPLNVLEGGPDPRSRAPAYTPLWDLHLAMWSREAISAEQRVKLITISEARAFAERGLLVSAMPGVANPLVGGLNANGVVVNCPVIATFAREAPR